MQLALFLSVCLIAACGLIYELVAGALASYLLGDSVTQFSTIIGTYLFAMGIGSWLSRFVVRGVVTQFVVIELLVGVVGGVSSLLLFLAFAYTEAFRFTLYSLVMLIGTLVGLEIPLLMRILKDRFSFKDVVANVLTFDYIGALFASLLFPLLLVPRLGLVRSALLFGVINVLVGLWSTWLFRDVLPRRRWLQGAGIAALLLLGAGLWKGQAITTLAEEGMYADPIILAKDTRYQRIVLTSWKDDLRLYLNGHLQFAARDEYRYHEALVHPGLSAGRARGRVLVLGGGDGLAVREILKYPDVQRVTLVDLDEGMTALFKTHPRLTALNAKSLLDPRVEVVNDDAFTWLDAHPAQFDFVVIDFPDPSNYHVGKLYTSAFYRLVKQHLAPGAFIAVQSTSPMFARQSYWSIVTTLEGAGLRTWPYHVYVPSFGEWGFVIAGLDSYAPPSSLPGGLRYLTAASVPGLFDFPADMQRVPAEPNRLNDQVLVRYYEHEFDAINR
ncbi:polyamine aminopropyltransferase [Gemmatimonas phototrophica]|uniref:Polyamine aminopropyltransferase n=1 Tax=Gemmatimonas phototrophica TaxID=1379270 RepID=A0A143BMU1_9BACT|nr:polyamine aminopropyltransferase [Gemmatimonas phototrophica]AMW05832.1 spermidine synthase [Gemmatimonas phototrophica]